MLKRFNRLLALAAVLFAGFGLWATPQAPPTADAVVPNRTMGPAPGGDQGAIVDRVNRRRAMIAAREAEGKRVRAALIAKGGKVNPALFGKNPAGAPQIPGGSQAVTGKGAGGPVLGLAVPGPGFQLAQPDYMMGTESGWHNTKPIRKFVDTLPGIGAANASTLGNYIPFATPDQTTYPGSDYYQIDVVQYYQQLHSELNPTLLRGYQAASGLTAGVPLPIKMPTLPLLGAASATGTPVQSNYLGPIIIAKKDRAVRVKMNNKLPVGAAGDLFIPVDTTMMGAGTGPAGVGLGSALFPEVYTQNRVEFHLHGGLSPWISDGTPHQWITPAGETTSYPKGAVFQNVPDMGAGTAGDGIATYFWSNQQSGRLMFYHDHAFGLTRLNVYAGTAAGYLIVDPVETKLINAGIIPSQGSKLPISDDPWDTQPFNAVTHPVNPPLYDAGDPTANPAIPAGGLQNVYAYGIPLVIQDKTFVDTAKLGKSGVAGATDPTWDVAKYGGDGSLWYPHVYMPNQDPNSLTGATAMGRWDYGPWFWPPLTLVTQGGTLVHGSEPALDAAGNPVVNPINGIPLEIPGTPNPSLVPEAFMDTPVVNGVAYPTITVEPASYRFRILSAGNDRNFNLSFFVADMTGASPGTEVTMVPAADITGTWAAQFPTWPTDGRAGGVPDPLTAGPSFVQIGNESGFLPTPVVIPPQAVAFDFNRRNIVVLNILYKGLFLAPAERADVVVDFSAFAGKTLILYNDAPAPVPAFDPRYDYYTNSPDQTANGGAAPTAPGYGPNTRTVMQFVVKNVAPAPAFDVAALNAAFLTTATSKSAFVEAQHLPIVPHSVYNSTLGKVAVPAPAPIAPATTVTAAQLLAASAPAWPNMVAGTENWFINNVYARIQDHKILTPFPSNENGTLIQPVLLNKAIQELFELDYGRMNATLGVEIPNTNARVQTTIPLGYKDPTTENLNDGETQYWKITHNGVDTHPVHFHLFDVQVINRVGWDGAVRWPDPNELGWKETLRMNPLEDCIVAFRPLSPRMPANMSASMGSALPLSSHVPDVTLPATATITWTSTSGNNIGNIVTGLNTAVPFDWEYVWHCHILGHEENDFMRPLVLHVATAVPNAPTVLAAASPILPGRADLSWTDNNTDASANRETGFSVQRRDPVVVITPAVAQVGTPASADYVAASANYVPASANYVPASADYVPASADYVPAVIDPVTGLVTTPQVGTAQVGTAQVGTAQVGTPQVGTPASANYAPAVAAVTGPGSWVQVGTTVPNQNRYSDFSIKANTPYDYQVVAYNQAGNSAASNIINFAAQPISYSGLAYSIVGGVNVPTDGVVITFVGTSNNASTAVPANTTATTDATGAYSATLPYMWTGTVTPSHPAVTLATGTLATPWAYSPVGLSLTSLVVNTVQNFVTRPLVTVSGNISTTASPVAGVKVTFSNGGGIATTDGLGNYSLLLPSGYSGTATPVLNATAITPGYTFALPAITYANVTVDQAAKNYVATAGVTISGTITAGGSPVAGVTVTYQSTATGAPALTATTNAAGNYTLTLDPGVAGWSGTVTPTLLNYLFSTTPVPASPVVGTRTYGTLYLDQAVQNFYGSTVVAISGTIKTNLATNLQGVTLTASTGQTATTLADGTYSFLNLPAPYTGTITPSLAATATTPGYSFALPATTYTGISVDQTFQDYTATAGVTVSGTILTSTGGPLVGATVTYNPGAASAVSTAVLTDAAGKYSLVLTPPYTGTVTPTMTNYVFSTTVVPANPIVGSRSYTTLYLDSLAQDYTASMIVTIKGTITADYLVATGLPGPLAGVTLTASTGQTATTAADGTYTFSNLPGPYTGTITPTLAGTATSPVYAFTALSITYTAVTTDQLAQNYAAKAGTVLSGTVLNGGVGEQGVLLTFAPGVTATTNAAGFYTITLPAPYNGTVVPSKANFVFAPATSVAFTNLVAGATTQDFTATPTVTISGTISGLPAGVVASLGTFNLIAAGQTAATATPTAITATGPTGTYSFTVAAPFTATITPTATGLSFTAGASIMPAPAGPASRVYTAQALGVLSAENYLAYATISGQVQLNTNGTLSNLAGVTMTYTGGVTTTDASGLYAINVTPGWAGSVTPTKPGYFITPLSTTYPAVLAHQPAQNYTAVLAITIFGQVTTNGVPSIPLQGVTITVTGAATVVTDVNGLYTTVVPQGWTGTITPTLANWAFTPVNRTLTNLQTAPAGQHFTARATVTVTGNIKTGATNLSGVTVSFSNGGGTTITDVNGNYSRIVNAGWFGTITPSGRGFIYSPAGFPALPATVTIAAPGLTLASTLAYDFMTVQTIAGRARTRDSFGQNVPLAGVTFTLSAGTTTGTFTTLADGNFTFRVPTGQAGSVSAQTLPGGPFTSNQSTGGALMTISPTRWLTTAPVIATTILDPVSSAVISSNATYTYAGTGNISGLRFDAR